MEVTAAWVGIILVVLAHIVSTVWWAAKVSTLLVLVQETLSDLSVEMKAVNKTYVSKEDFSRERAVDEKEHQALWKNIDEIKALVNHNGRS